MVLSRINDNIDYSEKKYVDPEDTNFEASLYEIIVKEIKIIIALGDIKYTYSTDGILYSIIYLIKNDTVFNQIGVYEFDSTNVMELLDEDGDLEIEKLDNPLFYKFVTDQYLKKHGTPKEKEEQEEEKEEEEEEKEEEEEGKGGVSVPPGEEPMIPLKDETFNEGNELSLQGKLETKEEDMQAQAQYIKTDNNHWIQNFMKRSEYGLEDPLLDYGGLAGDCLFAVIQEALKSIGKIISINKMREKLSDEMTETQFNHYKEFYSTFQTQIDKDLNELENLKKLHNDLRIRGEGVKTSNRSEYLKIVKNAKQIEQTFRRIKNEIQTSQNYLKEFDFMENIETLDQMKQKIRTCDFWAETWAISTLEKIYNIKLIILSSENYKNNEEPILLCGQINDDRELDKGTFKPDYYIITDHTGDHYKLITWKDTKIFTFKEIPYGLRNMIVNKCMEIDAGKFSYIPEFKEYKKMEQNPITQTVLQFYSRSSGKPFPGKGAGEKLNDPPSTFGELSKIPNWRKRLSNFDKTPFTLDGKEWQSVEHYYHASKFKKDNPDFYATFSLDSKSELSKDPLAAKKAGGKKSNVKMDSDFFESGRNITVMNKAWEAKFQQNEELKDILIKTNNAILQHFVRGKEPEKWNNLMKIREKIKLSNI